MIYTIFFHVSKEMFAVCWKEPVAIKIYSEDFAAGNSFVCYGMLAGAVEINSKIQ